MVDVDTEQEILGHTSIETVERLNLILGFFCVYNPRQASPEDIPNKLRDYANTHSDELISLNDSYGHGSRLELTPSADNYRIIPTNRAVIVRSSRLIIPCQRSPKTEGILKKIFPELELVHN